MQLVHDDEAVVLGDMRRVRELDEDGALAEGAGVGAKVGSEVGSGVGWGEGAGVGANVSTETECATALAMLRILRFRLLSSRNDSTKS